MERESNSMQALCRSGCGFYGNPSTDGFCSLCYKEALKKKQQPPGPSPSSPSTNSVVTTAFNTSATNFIDTAVPTIPIMSPIMSQSHTEKTDVNKDELSVSKDAKSNIVDNSTIDGIDRNDSSGSNSNDADDKEKGKKKNRCGICKKKVGLTGFECRCGGLFCGVHRYSDKHNCSFDYRQLGAQEIRRNNPVVIGEKIQKI